MQVRLAFEQALEGSGAADGERLGFYLACGDYLRFSMERLHRQDQLIHDYLKERLPAGDGEAHERLDELQRRQTKSRELMAGFGQQLEALRAAGRDGVAAFAAAARDFLARFKALLAPRKNPFAAQTDRLFGPADWVRIAGVSDASLAEEAALFSAVRASAPAGIDPESLEVRHH